MLQMLHGANAKNESSGFFLFCFFARIGGFPSRYVCVCVGEGGISAYMCALVSKISLKLFL